MKRLGIIVVILLSGALLYSLFAGRPPAVQEPKAPSTSEPLKTKAPKLQPRGNATPPTQDSEFSADPVGTLRLTGQVVDEQNKPAPDVRLALSTHPIRYATSDSGGLFAFEGLLARTYYLEGRREDLSGDVETQLTEDEIPVTLTLHRNSAIRVTVLDAIDRHPIEGAKVSSGWQLKSEALTGADGQVSLFSASAWATVTVFATGYAPYIESFPTPLNTAEAIEREILLHPGASVSGLVVDDKGAPVAGASIWIEASAERDGYFGWINEDENKIVSDEQGRWTIPALSAGTFRFFATSKKLATGTSAPVTLDGKTPTTDVIIQMKEGASLSGRVVDLHGDPVAGAVVRAQRDANNNPQSKRTHSDERGQFFLEGLAKEKIFATASKDGARAEGLSVDLSAGSVSDAVLQLSIVGEISGVVMLVDGSPVEGAQVGAYYEPQESVPPGQDQGVSGTTSNFEGRFTLKGVPKDKRYKLFVFKENLDAPDVSTEEDTAIYAKAGDTNVLLVMKARGAITGKLLFTDNTPPAKAKVSAAYQEPPHDIAPDGSFFLPNAPARSWIFPKGPFVSKNFGPFAVQPGETLDVGTLFVERGRKITGKVTLADGSPVDSAAVYLNSRFNGNGLSLSDDDREPPTTRSGADGSFVAEGRPDSDELYAVAEHPTKGRSQIIKLDKSKEDLVLELVLESTSALEGTITYQGEPCVTIVEVTPELLTYGGKISVRSNEEGFYRFDALTPGRYLFTASNGQRGSIKTITVTVAPNKTNTANLEIPSGVEVKLLATRDGAPASGLTFYLLRGSFNPKDQGQLNAVLRPLKEDEVRTFTLRPESKKEAIIKDVVAGSYTLCLQPFPSYDPNAPIEEEPAPLIVSCSAVTITPSPKTQTISRALP